MTFDWLESGTTARGVTERGFNLTRGSRSIPGLLWTPEEAPDTPPLVLLGHGGSGHKRQAYILAVARMLVRHHGIAAVAIDGPVHGDRRADRDIETDQAFHDFGLLWRDDPTMTDEMVADWRAVLDELQEPSRLGPGPVGWWGLSMGTIIGMPVVAAEPRILVAVLGLMGLTGPTKDRLATDAAKVQCPVLFLVQWDDELFKRDRALDLFSALAPKDKQLHANPGGHVEVPPAEFRASVSYLADRISV